MGNMKLWVRASQGTMALLATLAVTAPAQQLRPMSLDDLFAIRTLGGVAPAPSGAQTAVVVQRSWRESPAFRPYNMFGNDQADVWLIPAVGGQPLNLTRGAERGVGYWSPVWSPDSRHLAVLSTEGGDNVRPVLLNVRTGARRRLSERGVDLRAALGAEGEDPTPMRWLDERRLLVALLPVGLQPEEFAARRATPAIATAGWQRTHAGTRPAVSVLSTDSASRPPDTSSRLVVIDVVTGDAISIVDGPFGEMAPSPSGDRLALVTRLPGVPTAIVIVEMRSGAVTPQPTTLTIGALRWTPSGRLLAWARDTRGTRNDWWVLDRDGGGGRNLTGTLAAPPQGNAIPLGDSAVVLSAAGKLWHVPLAGGAPVAWGSGIEGMVTGIVWPRHREDGASRAGRIAVTSRHEGTRRLYEIDLRTASATPYPPPAGRARVVAVDAVHRRAFFATDRPEATVLWAAKAGANVPTRALALNEHLAGVATSRRVLLRYRASTGDSLSAVVLLPVHYVPGKRYPMVTWVYPGVIVTDTASSTVDFWLAKNHAHQDNLHLLAGRGYAVLIPSMPVGEVPREPYAELPNGVLPAVDAAVAAGIADSARVAVMGQSAGGFATFGLITQTQRFAAAIAVSGFANLLSNYGTFDGERRYRDDAHRAGVQMRSSEGGQLGLGSPPWADPARYVRNSPLLHVDRARTPLLIVHGDLDYVPIQQAEEFFTALQRLGRPSEFVRYWGESHGAADSSANARDKWERVLAWLDRWL
jgi:dipeptidyl aminopeptidase/acylaminoacyl peptidase